MPISKTHQKYNGLVISGPSGAGKSTLLNEAMAMGFHQPVSYTTRTIRPGEIDGVNYHYVSQKQFSAMASEGEFIETTNIFGHLYGTSLAELCSVKGFFVMDLDLDGVLAMKRKKRDLFYLLVMPPSQEVMRQRLIARGCDEGSLEVRIQSWQSFNDAHVDFDITLCNDDKSETINTFHSIVKRLVE